MSCSPSSSDSDCGSDSATYSFKDYQDLIRPLLNSSASIELDSHTGLRTLTDFALSHSLSMKSLQKRETKLSDLYISKIQHTNEHNSVQELTALVIKNSINNGPIQYYGCLRHKFVETCPHLAISMYLFSRFHITDEYGSIELTNNFINDPLFHETRLLKGTNRFQSMSYCQQHKSASKVLKLVGYQDPKSINLGKFLTSSQYERDSINSNDKPISINITNLPSDTLFQMAGFINEDYFIERNQLEPPQELLNQIFPFINDDNEPKHSNPELNSEINMIKAVFRMLRRSLVQDMVIIKQRYPRNIIAEHPIFNNEIFDSFVSQMVAKGIVNISRSPSNSPSILPPITSVLNSPKLESLSSLNKVSEKLQELYDNQIYQDSKIRQLQEQLTVNNQLHNELYQNLQTFIGQQNEVFQQQSEYLQKIHSTNNGLAVLMASRNPTSNNLIQSSLIDVSNNITKLNNSSIQQGLTNTVQLLVKLKHTNDKNHLQFLHNQTVYSPPSSYYPVNLQNPHPASYIPRSSTPSDQDDKEELQKKKVLNRRLSRQAITLYEMWDDFTSLENDLKKHNISITEWLKVHGSSERQFRHTRMKIIRFVEEEAQRRNCSVEEVKEKLHNKMRNRLRLWTLDEVQRMLTSGRRIDLD